MKRPRASILVVEDDVAILQGLLDVLVFNGYEATGVEDGGEGLQEALEGRYDLIILDVMLPTTDGFAICTEIRRKKPGQPVVMLTAKGSEDDIVTGFKAGADDYVSKPFSLRELMVRVEAVLRRAGKNLGDEQIHSHSIFFDAKTLMDRYALDFYLVNVVVSDDTARLERALSRASARDPQTLSEMAEHDAREERIFGIDKAAALARTTMKNDGTLDDLQAEVDAWMAEHFPGMKAP